MITDQKIQKASDDFVKAIEHLKLEFSRLQVGRASASLVEGISVESYGTAQPLKAVANISASDSKTITIQPWDKNMLGAIEKAIRASDLGLSPINDGLLVRINIPPLTEERRRDLTKVVHQIAEEAKIAVRNIRQGVHSRLKELKDNAEITEDDLRGSQKRLQDEVDEANKQIDELAKHKEADVLKI